jgi:beta-glucanase (GH16 family)
MTKQKSFAVRYLSEKWKKSIGPGLSVLTIAFMSVLFGCSHSGKLQDKAASAYAPEGYKMVWSDEFNHNGPPDTMNWKYENGFVRNEEFQWYQKDNASCKNGMLVIEARRETKPNARYEEGSRDWRRSRKNIEYTSSSINTSGKHAWMYGRFVMRGRIDISNGLWPAWWTLGVAGRWPANGEIDIMEFYRKKLLANIACLGPERKAEWFSKTKAIDSLGGASWASKFHTWRMDWDENEIALYVDDMLMNKVELSKLANKDASGINPFKQPHYMLLNLAIGGQNGGDPSNTKFPNRYEVDYVRVYQKNLNF